MLYLSWLWLRVVVIRRRCLEIQRELLKNAGISTLASDRWERRSFIPGLMTVAVPWRLQDHPQGAVASWPCVTIRCFSFHTRGMLLIFLRRCRWPLIKNISLYYHRGLLRVSFFRPFQSTLSTVSTPIFATKSHFGAYFNIYQYLQDSLCIVPDFLRTFTTFASCFCFANFSEIS